MVENLTKFPPLYSGHINVLMRTNGAPNKTGSAVLYLYMNLPFLIAKPLLKSLFVMKSAL